ncbi:MAG: hypothetical protein ACFFG0_37360 [Candidatus Thorarchaeota archaeon]
MLSTSEYGLNKIINSWLIIFAIPMILLILISAIPLFIYSYIVGFICLGLTCRKSIKEYREGNCRDIQEFLNEL